MMRVDMTSCPTRKLVPVINVSRQARLTVFCVKRDTRPQKQKASRPTRIGFQDNDDDASFKKSYGRGSRVDQTVQIPKKKQPERSRKQSPVVFFWRSDFQKNLKPPPWTLYSHCSLRQLALDDLLQSSRFAEEADETHSSYIPPPCRNRGSADELSAEEANLYDVNVTMMLTPAGENFYLAGQVKANGWSCCDRCGEEFRNTLESDLKLWLTSTENPFVDDPDEIYMPAGTNSVDLTAAVRESITLSVPPRIICGRTDCNDPASRSWSVGGSK
mmetsp:Transcript_1301/g.2265  ORF Transcript_1301/g.2265 Transcript_1301/m.2265 type:complete len:273 (-) Transcript_1301:219-1037(-)